MLFLKTVFPLVPSYAFQSGDAKGKHINFQGTITILW